MKSGKIFLGILTAASAGALLGTLFAPRTGKDTRKKIVNTTKEYADTFLKKFDENLDKLTGKLKKVKNEASEFAHQTRVKEEKLKKEYGVENS